jgi:hypothetical protein
MSQEFETMKFPGDKNSDEKMEKYIEGEIESDMNVKESYEIDLKISNLSKAEYDRIMEAIKELTDPDINATILVNGKPIVKS